MVCTAGAAFQPCCRFQELCAADHTCMRAPCAVTPVQKLSVAPRSTQQMLSALLCTCIPHVLQLHEAQLRLVIRLSRDQCHFRGLLQDPVSIAQHDRDRPEAAC